MRTVTVIIMFLALLTCAATGSAFDITRAYLVPDGDLPAGAVWVNENTCQADCNNDGRVSILDFLIWRDEYFVRQDCITKPGRKIWVFCYDDITGDAIDCPFINDEEEEE